MKVTAIIPSLYEVDKDYLKLTVESLRETTKDWDIIVVTNGKTGPPKLDIKGVTNHFHVPKQGQCNAVNVGATQAHADTDYLFISNSDMYYAPDWKRALKFKYPVFSPNLIEPINNAGSAPPFRKFDGGYTLEEFKKDEVDEYVFDEFYEERRDETGFNFPVFIRKDVWDTIGGYDVKFDPWGSNGDTDLQTKINLAGITPMRLRDVLVYHFSNKSGTFDGTHQAEWQQNWDYFNQKWGFNRDDLGSDVWYNKDTLPKDLKDSKYQPEWINKFKEKESE